MTCQCLFQNVIPRRECCAPDTNTNTMGKDVQKLCLTGLISGGRFMTLRLPMPTTQYFQFPWKCHSRITWQDCRHLSSLLEQLRPKMSLKSFHIKLFCKWKWSPELNYAKLSNYNKTLLMLWLYTQLI